MLSFKQYLLESDSAPGNYVCAYCNFPFLPDHLYPKTGIKSEKEPHITLMYSEYTNVDDRVLKSFLTTIPQQFGLQWDHVDVFDSEQDEESNEKPVAALVLKVKSSTAVAIHEALKTLGMQHSYEEFSPHVTIAYKVDREEAWECASRINEFITSNREVLMPLETTHVEFAPIDKEWVSKL
jgi:2'-5' RNA ligase